MRCGCGGKMRFLEVKKQSYFLCETCGFLKKQAVLPKEEQKRRYDFHVCDAGYRRYMERIKQQILPFIREGLCLDYGCGSIHLLSTLLENQRIACDYYDLFYYPTLTDKQYDTIILIEVFEHLEHPFDELTALLKHLKKGGRLIIKTKPYPPERLETWWYLRDATHVSFVSEKTFLLWQKLFPFSLIWQKDDIFVLERI